MRKLFAVLIIIMFSAANACAQNVGVGTTTPAEKLEVAGNIKGDTAILEGIKITDNAAVGAVLTSNDALGNAKWVKPVKVLFKATGFKTNFTVAYNVEEKLNKWDLVDVQVGVNAIFGGDFYYNPTQGDFFILKPGVYRISVKVHCYMQGNNPFEGGHVLNIKKNDVTVASFIRSIPKYSNGSLVRTENSSKFITTILSLNSQDKITFTFKNTLEDPKDAMFFADGVLPIPPFNVIYDSNDYNEFTIEKVD